MSFLTSAANPVIKTIVPVAVSAESELGSRSGQCLPSETELTSRSSLPWSPCLAVRLPWPFSQALTFGLQGAFAVPAIIQKTEKNYDVSTPGRMRSR